MTEPIGDMWKKAKGELWNETEEEEKLYWEAIEAASRYLDVLENNDRDIPKKFVTFTQHVLFDHFWDWVDPTTEWHLKHRQVIRGCYEKFHLIALPESLEKH